jgi:hypothetical protein
VRNSAPEYFPHRMYIGRIRDYRFVINRGDGNNSSYEPCGEKMASWAAGYSIRIYIYIKRCMRGNSHNTVASSDRFLALLLYSPPAI